MSAESGLKPAGDGNDRFIWDWLLRAADKPDEAWRDWSGPGVTLLRCDRSFAAVRIPPQLVHAALGTTDPAAIAEALACDLGGPVIHDGHATSNYYALIQWHAGMVWDGEDDTPCLARDHYLGVPHLNRTAPPGPHWVVSPRHDEQLCRLSTVRVFIARARKKLAPADSPS